MKKMYNILTFFMWLFTIVFICINISLNSDFTTNSYRVSITNDMEDEQKIINEMINYSEENDVNIFHEYYDTHNNKITVFHTLDEKISKTIYPNKSYENTNEMLKYTDVSGEYYLKTNDFNKVEIFFNEMSQYDIELMLDLVPEFSISSFVYFAKYTILVALVYLMITSLYILKTYRIDILVKKVNGYSNKEIIQEFIFKNILMDTKVILFLCIFLLIPLYFLNYLTFSGMFNVLLKTTIFLVIIQAVKAFLIHIMLLRKKIGQLKGENKNTINTLFLFKFIFLILLTINFYYIVDELCQYSKLFTDNKEWKQIQDYYYFPLNLTPENVILENENGVPMDFIVTNEFYEYLTNEYQTILIEKVSDYENTYIVNEEYLSLNNINYDQCNQNILCIWSNEEIKNSSNISVNKLDRDKKYVVFDEEGDLSKSNVTLVYNSQLVNNNINNAFQNDSVYIHVTEDEIKQIENEIKKNNWDSYFNYSYPVVNKVEEKILLLKKKLLDLFMTFALTLTCYIFLIYYTLTFFIKSTVKEIYLKKINGYSLRQRYLNYYQYLIALYIMTGTIVFLLVLDFWRVMILTVILLFIEIVFLAGIIKNVENKNSILSLKGKI